MWASSHKVQSYRTLFLHALISEYHWLKQNITTCSELVIKSIPRERWRRRWRAATLRDDDREKRVRTWWSKKKKLRGGKICNRCSAHTPFFPTFTLCWAPPPSPSIWFDPVNFASNQNHCLWLAASLISTLSAPPSKMKRQFSRKRATVILLLMMLSPLLSLNFLTKAPLALCSSF